MPWRQRRAKRSQDHSGHLGPGAELPHEAVARFSERRAQQRDHVTDSQGLGRGRSAQDRGLFRGQDVAARRASAKPPLPPKGIAQCQACHQPNFQGGMPAPRLAGLSYEYLVAAMRAFATEQRINNLDMPKFMQVLTERERNAIARYLSAL